jgi:hypothetical protein
MKKLLLLSTLLLSGCATPGVPGNPGTIAEYVKLVQTYAVQGCSFLPTAQTVMNIYAQGQYTLAFTMARAICDAVVAPTVVVTRAQGVPIVSGVVVRGQFIKTVK